MCLKRVYQSLFVHEENISHSSTCSSAANLSLYLFTNRRSRHMKNIIRQAIKIVENIDNPINAIIITNKNIFYKF